MSGWRVGITIGLQAPDESLWVNGIKQNALYLAQALRHVPSVGPVHLVNTSPVPVTDALPWDRQCWPTVAFDEARDTLDLLIELGGQVGPDQTDYIKQRGTRLVSYCCGVEYVNAMQAMLFNRPLWGQSLFINPRYDAVWVVPQAVPPACTSSRRCAAAPCRWCLLCGTRCSCSSAAAIFPTAANTGHAPAPAGCRSWNPTRMW